ncbi:hypothetical protein, partial [Lacticaseibacillus paracasei]
AQYIPLIREAAARIYPRLKRGFDLDMMARGLLGMAVQVGTVWARGGCAQTLEEVVSYSLYAWRGLELWVGEMAGTQKAA